MDIVLLYFVVWIRIWIIVGGGFILYRWFLWVGGVVMGGMREFFLKRGWRECFRVWGLFILFFGKCCCW